VSKKQRNLVDGHTCKQHLNGEGIPEHVGMTPLLLAVGLLDIGELEETTIASLPVCHGALGVAIAAPEKVAGIWLRAGGNIFESLDHMRRKRNINRRSGLGLIEQKAVAMKPMPLKSHRVSDAETTPAHQQRHGAKTGPQVLNGNKSAARISVDVRRIKNPLKLVAREVVGRHLYDLDLAQAHGRILANVATADAGPEEADQTVLLFLLGQAAILPGTSEGEQRVEIDLIEVVQSLHSGPSKELLAEDGFEL